MLVTYLFMQTLEMEHSLQKLICVAIGKHTMTQSNGIRHCKYCYSSESFGFD